MRRSLGLLLLCACAQKDEGEDTGGDSDSGSPVDTDEELPVQDADGDGSPAEEDCDDADGAVYPGAPEHCGDGRLTDCDRVAEDGLVTLDGATSFDDLQAALDAAASGSELLVCAGVHAGPFVASVAVTLRAHGEPGEVVLSGSDAGTTLSVPGGSALHGLALREGAGDIGGALQLTSAGTLLLEDCRLSASRARLGGGLALAQGGTATLVRSAIEGNEAVESGGGIYALAGSTLELTEGSTVAGNRTPGAGAGLYLVGASLVGGAVIGNVVESDPIAPTSVGSGGGGVWTSGACTLTDVEIAQNEAPQGAGVMNVLGELVLADVRVHDNATTPYGAGGGLLSREGLVQMTGTSELSANRAYDGAGAVLSDSPLVGGTLRDNVAESYGGGMYLRGSSVEGAVVQGNRAESGGGLSMWAGGSLLDVTVRDNEANEEGGGVSVAAEEGEPVELVRIEGGSIADNFGENGAGMSATIPVEVLGTALIDNIGVYGGGVYVAGATIRLEELAVLRNFADQGGGVSVGPGAELVALNVNFGEGADDNSSSDIHAGSAYSDLGPETSLECSDDGCTELP
jgi:hypothetical protein